MKPNLLHQILTLHPLYCSKYPCDQAVIPTEIPRGNGSRAKGSISCSDEAN